MEGPLQLDVQQRNRLKACFALSGIEKINGNVAGLSDELSTPTSGQENEAVYTIPEDLWRVGRQVTLFGLRHEFAFVDGLCESDFIDQARARIDSPHGLQGLLDLLAIFSPHQQDYQGRPVGLSPDQVG